MRHGWTETRLDYEDNPEGDPKVDRVDPLEMVWDSGAKKRNLVDGRRLAHIRRSVPIDEARALCPGDAQPPFEDADYNASWIGEEGERRTTTASQVAGGSILNRQDLLQHRPGEFGGAASPVGKGVGKVASAIAARVRPTPAALARGVASPNP
jgi:hypothetical protein